MKKLKIIIPILLLALVQIYSFMYLPKDAPVSASCGSLTVQLSEKDAQEVISIMNRYPFWMLGDGYWCDCASEFRINIGDTPFAFAGSHCHHHSKWLTLRMLEWDSEKIKGIIEKYLVP